MDNMLLVVGVAVVILFAVLAMSVKRVAPDERLIVERFGMHNRTAGPGWSLTVPVIERGILVPLTEFMPGWKGYPEEHLRKKLIEDYYRKANRAT